MTLKRLAALTVSTFTFLMSPGFGAYEAFARSVAAPQAATTGASVVVPGAALGLAPNASFGIGSNLAAPGLATSLPVIDGALLSPTAAPTAAVAPARAVAISAPSSINAAPAAAPLKDAASVSPARQAPAKIVTRTLGPVGAALKAVENVGEASAGSAHTMGVSLENALTGIRSNTGSDSAVPVAARFASVRSGLINAADAKRQFARPAGSESIAAAVASLNGAAPEETPVESKGHSAPLAARIVATLIAALPAVVLGAPLILGGSILGYGIAAASLGLMTMPYFGPKTSKFVRVAPGVALMALGTFSAGAAVVGLGVAALSTAPFWMGALVTLGGWGMVRFGAQPDKEYFDEGKVLTAFFGGLASVAGVGLIALGVPGVLAAVGSLLPGVAASAWAGWVVTGASWLSWPLAAMLLMHLPGWVGEGIGSAVDGLLQSVRGTLRTALSIHRDTVMRDRLEAWTEKKLELNKWNFWKVAAVWAPILVVEAVMGLTAIAVGAVLGALQAPTMFLWGASHKLAPESAATKFLASWNRTVFYNAQGSKKRIYNKLATPLIRAANSDSVVKSWPAGALLRLLQIGWLAYAAVATPFLLIGGFFKAFANTGAAYDSKMHSPHSMRLDRNDSPVEKPLIDKDKPVSDVIPAGLIATALVGLPAYFFGLPLIGAPLIGAPYLVLGALIAAMPLLPASTPKWVRQVPGYAMAAFGLLAMAAVPYMSFAPAAFAAALSALQSNAFWFGAVTALSGFGFAHNITKLAKEKEGKKWAADDPEYIGAFLGSLGVLTGAGLAFTGVGGWLTALMIGSYLASGLLLIHLPKWFWTGVKTVFQGGFWSAGRFHKIVDFWGGDTKFRTNMRKHASYYLEGSIWKIIGNSTWLSLIWVPTGLLMLAEALLSIALGAAVGVVRAPLNWAWGALYEMDKDAKITRFVAGWARHSNQWVEGEIGRKKIFLGALEKLGLLGAMNESVLPSGRPSLKAVLAFVAARVLQVFYLVGSLGLVLPASLLTGLYAGFRNASGAKKQPDKDSDEYYYDLDDPDALS